MEPDNGPEHEILPQPDNIYSMAGPNTGRPADLRITFHYPVESVCAGEGCGQVIRLERMYLADWEHTGRRPGDTKTAGMARLADGTAKRQ